MKDHDLELFESSDRIDDVLATMTDGLEANSPKDVPPYKPIPLTITLRDPGGGIEGGLHGESVWDWLYIKYLWVAETRRGSGLGAKLMAAAEEIAEKRGCVGIWLKTESFQAPGFYERQGYRPFGELNDAPKGHQQIFYRKMLASASRGGSDRSVGIGGRVAVSG